MVKLLLGADIYKNIRLFEQLEKILTYDVALLTGTLNCYRPRKKQTIACLDNENWSKLINSRLANNFKFKHLEFPSWGHNIHYQYNTTEFPKIMTVGGQYSPKKFKSLDNKYVEFRKFQHESEFINTKNVGQVDIVLANTPPTGILQRHIKSENGLPTRYDFGNRNINKLLQYISPFWLICCYDGDKVLFGDLKHSAQNETRIICLPRNSKYMYLYDTENDNYISIVEYKNGILSKRIQDLDRIQL